MEATQRPQVRIEPTDTVDLIRGKLLAAGVSAADADEYAARIHAGLAVRPHPVVRTVDWSRIATRERPTVPREPVCGKPVPCGRNAACPCKSGRKWKKCCGARQ